MTDMTTTMTTSRRLARMVSIPFRFHRLPCKLVPALEEIGLSASEACVVTMLGEPE